MARFSVYQNHGNEGYLIDVQADLMAHLNTRLVVPLVPLRKAPKPAKTLNPLFMLEDVEHVMLTHYAAAIPLNELKREVEDVAGQTPFPISAPLGEGVELLLDAIIEKVGSELEEREEAAAEGRPWSPL